MLFNKLSKLNKLKLFISGSGLFISGIIYLLSITFFNVGPGEVGVIYQRFGKGTITDSFLKEGAHLIAPWNKIYLYSTRIQNHREDYKEILTKNGLTVTVHIAYRYRIKASEVGKLHKDLGPDYLESVVLATISSVVREVIGRYTPDHLYSTNRTKLQEEINEQFKKIMKKEGYYRYFESESILMRGIDLPDRIDKAIQEKLEREQRLQQYSYEQKIAEEEAKRKKTEAEGIAIANKIINRSLTPMLLENQRIKSMEELAKSNNTKIINISGIMSTSLIIDSEAKEERAK